MKVSEIMNKAVAVESDASLRSAAKVMSDKNIGSLIVMKDDKIIGIITENDIVKNFSGNKSISQAMTKNVVTIDKNASIDEAAKIMKQNKIKRIPVVYNNELVGIVTATDLLANAEELNEEFFFD